MSATPPARIEFVHILRAVAALMVVYCHLIGGRAEAYGNNWWPHTVITTYFIAPSHITQNFGFFGVALFFLISGFVITHVAQQETRVSFIVKRTFRLYPPLIVSILIALVAYQLEAIVIGQPYAFSTLPTRDILLSMTMLDVIAGTPLGALAVGWTLTIELVFYVHVALLFPLVQTRPLVASALLIVWGVVGTHLFIGAGLHTVGEMTHYLPLFAIGMAVRGWSRNRSVRHLPLIFLVLAGLEAYIINLVMMKPWALGPTEQFPVQVIYALGVFTLFCFVGERYRGGRVLRWVGDISYSLYLIHVPVGFLVADFLVTRVGITGAVAGGLVTAFVFATAIHVAVEVPSQGLARKLLRRGRRDASAKALASTGVGSGR